MTREHIRTIAAATIREHGLGIVHELKRGENFGGSNLCALMALFAEALEAAKAPDIVGVIDAKMGAGWTRTLAEKLSQ